MKFSLPRPPFSLKLQLTAVFGALVIVASAAITWELSSMLQSRVRADAGRTLTFIASNAAQIFSTGLQTNASVVDMLARREVLWDDGLNSQEVQRTIDSLYLMQAHSAWVGVADASGMVRSATDGLLLGSNVEDRPWFAQARKNGLFVGDLHAAKLLEPLLPANASGEPLRFIDYSAPIRRNGRAIGVLGVHVNWDWAAEVIATVLPAEARTGGTEVLIFDRNGGIIFAPNAAGERPREKLRVPAVGSEASVVSWPDGAFLTAAVRLQSNNPTSDLGWTIVAREPAQSAFAPVHEARRRALLMGLLVALAGALLAGFAAHRFGADIRRMVRAVRDIEAGVSGAHIPSAGSSAEMRTLAKAVRSMTRRLISARGQLELQVRQRTHELEIANAELGRQAQTDALTGLLNRRVFDPMLVRMLADARRSGRELSVLMIDADHFKRINDIHGHAVGDEVLRTMADTLRGRLRPSDVIARFGGEEFAVLLPETSPSRALRVAQALVARMAEHADPVWGTVTVSIGVATCGDGLTAPEELLRRADEALYRAKAEGRNRVCVYR